MQIRKNLKFISLAVLIISLAFLFGAVRAQPSLVENIGAGPRVFVVQQGGTGTSTSPTAGDLLLSAADGSYGPAAIIAGSNMTITTSTYGQITFASTGGGGGSAAWEKYTVLSSPSEIITPTTTNASIYVSGSATTTGSVTFSSYTSCTALETDSNGLVVCGTDDTGGAGGAAWEQVGDNLQPTSTLTVKAPNGFLASSTVLFDSATTSDTHHINQIEINSQYLTDLVGTGLQNTGGSLETTLGTAIELGTAEVTGTLPTGRGGTGNTSSAVDYALLRGNTSLDAWVDFSLGAANTVLFSNGSLFSWASDITLANATLTTLNSTTTNIDDLTINDTSILGSATSTHFAVTTLIDCNTIDTDGNGTFSCGSDETGASVGAAWEELTTGVITPTTTDAGIWVTGSSTIRTLTVDDSLRATTTLDYWFDNTGGITGNSNIVTVGTLTTGATGAGFTVNLDDSTLTCTNCIDISANTNLAATSPITLNGDTVEFDFTTNNTWTGGNVFNNASTTITNLRVPDNLFATSSLIDTLTVGTSLDLNGASILNHYGTPCSGNNWLQDISDAGAFSCGALDTSGDWTGTLDSLEASQFLRSDAADTATGVITLSNGFVSSASSTITSDLRINTGSLFATTTLIDTLTVGTSFIFDSQTFDSLTDDATLTNNAGDLRVVDVSCTDCLNATEIEDIYLFNNADDTTNFGLTFGSATSSDSLYVSGVTQLTGATASSTGLVIGGDGVIYRSAANTLTLQVSTTTISNALEVTTNLRLAHLDCSGSSSLLQTDASGNVICGTDDSGGSGSAAWHATTTTGFLSNTITPTTTAASIVVQGTATTTGKLVSQPAFGSAFVQLWHDGTDGNLVHNTGDLNIGATGNPVYFDGATASSTAIVVSGDFNIFRSAANTLDFSSADTTLLSIDTTGIDLASGDSYQINGTSVLNATTLGSAVVNSSLTSVGTLVNLSIDSSGYILLPTTASPALDTEGQIAFDNTSDNLVAATSTNANLDSPVVLGSATTTLYAFVLASTSPDFVNGGIIELPAHFLKQVAIGVMCHVDAGTSVAINLSDGTNDTNSVTCSTTRAQHEITSNGSFDAYEAIRLEIGAISGTVDYLVVRFIGYRVSD